MDLSKLSTLAKKTFAVMIPSMKIEVYGKPYTLDDEITIASLFQLEDLRFFYAAIGNLLMEKYSLTAEQLNKLTHVDIQWLILHLKKNSDGNKLKIQFDCANEECKKTLLTEIDLNEIKLINENNFRKIIPITESVRLEIGLPPFGKFYEILQEFNKIDKKNPGELLKKDIDLFKASIKAFYDGDSVSYPEDLDPNEFDRIVRTELRTQYFEYINYREKEQPAIVYPKKIICASCKHENELTVEDFFYSTL